MSTTKKKKTAREKRVLIASIITAAAIVAGSTFAWFTSEDEVTNRLTSNADYGVSIVESFAPPENWLPGQNVNKDVYAVNTGNIDAFVKQEVSGVLTIAREIESAAAAPTADNVKLTDEERYVVEDGSYLALAPDTSTHEKGEKIVTRPADNRIDPNDSTPELGDFTPDVNGLYVFRRTIEVNADDFSEEFTYDAYYYQDGVYYKVRLDNITPDDELDYAADGKKTDGNLSEASYTLFEKETVKATPTLTYDELNNRLVATYGAGDESTNSLFNNISDTQLTEAAQELDRAQHNLTAAEEALEKAIAENSASESAVAKAQADLAKAQKELADIEARIAVLVSRKEALNTRITTLTGEISDLQTQIAAKATAIYGKENGNEEDYNSASTGDPYIWQAVVEANAALTAYGDTTSLDAYLADIGCTQAELDALTYEQLIAITVGEEHHHLHELTVAKKLAEKTYNEAKAELDALKNQLTAKQTELGNNTEGSETGLYKELADINGELGVNTEGSETGLYAEKVEKEEEIEGLIADVDAAATTEGSTNPASENLDDAMAAYKTALANYQAAKATYDKLDGNFDAVDALRIYIYLSDKVSTTGGYADKWQILPSEIQGDTAVFYYTSILPAGETSEKLIDSVKLDESVTKDMYDTFDFDLNIKLGSVQIAYEDDNETIKTEQTTSELGATATMADPKDKTSAITWTVS